MNALGINVMHDSCLIVCSDHGPVKWLDWTSCFYKDDIAVFRFYYAEDKTHEPDWCALLHTDEIERSWRYHRRDDRLRSLYTRSLLRILAGKFTNQNPLAIRLTKGLRNKPELSDNIGWHINATHSGNWILVAVGKFSVGIDIEEVKSDFTFTDVLPFSFSIHERKYIEDGEQPLVRFYELWTKKEALVKAFGSGIDETFPQVPALTGLHKRETTKLAGVGEWTINGFYVADEYPAAIAYNCSSRHPQFYTLDPDIFTFPTQKYEMI
ncbi:4'-phosphopantetheinyl transferase family protein [Salmonirosea aquatica]|uniref:4'-phosphopantetheinyl transferase superfamily protein n=1 Tax=Salmonirosea aquatica TaxID=2654236 RepID=A0A7C9FQ13_9BACT|nr:4'-phosphopantetheinyl transferase superfamily protein [Cytophagaceae bacterium SJW1-29]